MARDYWIILCVVTRNFFARILKYRVYAKNRQFGVKTLQLHFICIRFAAQRERVAQPPTQTAQQYEVMPQQF